MSDVRANAVQAGLKAKGQKMRRGIFYVNAAEGAYKPEDEREHISAIVPHRSGFKTHEDYVTEAHQRGEQIPEHVRKEYPHLR
jgi:hypothetical protein